MTLYYFTRIISMFNLLFNLSISLLPDLVEIQRNSFRSFLKEGLKDALCFLPILEDPTGSLELQFFGKECAHYW